MKKKIGILDPSAVPQMLVSVYSKHGHQVTFAVTSEHDRLVRAITKGERKLR